MCSENEESESTSVVRENTAKFGNFLVEMNFKCVEFVEDCIEKNQRNHVKSNSDQTLK